MEEKEEVEAEEKEEEEEEEEEGEEEQVVCASPARPADRRLSQPSVSGEGPAGRAPPAPPRKKGVGGQGWRIDSMTGLAWRVACTSDLRG